ncbi:hypothetical protein Ae201684P_013247 [Aphanomyces euteiches]|nr:hypothetical protein Ae201684P_013247 [Aphanomyces euteiches]
MAPCAAITAKRELLRQGQVKDQEDGGDPSDWDVQKRCKSKASWTSLFSDESQHMSSGLFPTGRPAKAVPSFSPSTGNNHFE